MSAPPKGPRQTFSLPERQGREAPAADGANAGDPPAASAPVVSGPVAKRPDEGAPTSSPAASGPVSKRTAEGPARDLRQALLDVAIELVAERGVDGLTLREAARRVGVTHPAVYRYFPDKAALLAAVAEEGFWSLRRALVAACTPFPEPVTRFQKLVVAYVTFAAERAAHFRIMFGPEAAEKWAHPSLRAAEQSAFGLALDIVIEGQRTKVFREGDPRELALGGWVMCHGLADLMLNGLVEWMGLPSTGLDYLATVLSKSLFEGLGATPLPESTESPERPPPTARSITTLPPETVTKPPGSGEG